MDPSSATVKYRKKLLSERLELHIKTSRTLRSIDRWKHSWNLRNHKFLGGVSVLLLSFGVAKAEAGLLVLFILGFAVHFAAVQFAALVLIGFFIAKLHLYRFANVFLKLGR